MSTVSPRDWPLSYRPTPRSLPHGQALLLLLDHERRQIDLALAGGAQLRRAGDADPALHRPTRRAGRGADRVADRHRGGGPAVRAGDRLLGALPGRVAA